MIPKNVTILLVDDDDVDAEGVERALRKRGIPNHIKRVTDGLEGLQELRSNANSPAPQPTLVLLDLNMPRMGGIEFLKEVRDDPVLHNTVIFVLTTSDDLPDKVAAYDKNIAGYLVKEKVGEQFAAVTDLVEDYRQFVEFPPPKERHDGGKS